MQHDLAGKPMVVTGVMGRGEQWKVSRWSLFYMNPNEPSVFKRNSGLTLTALEEDRQLFIACGHDADWSCEDGKCFYYGDSSQPVVQLSFDQKHGWRISAVFNPLRGRFMTHTEVKAETETAIEQAKPSALQQYQQLISTRREEIRRNRLQKRNNMEYEAGSELARKEEAEISLETSIYFNDLNHRSGIAQVISFWLSRKNGDFRELKVENCQDLVMKYKGQFPDPQYSLDAAHIVDRIFVDVDAAYAMGQPFTMEDGTPISVDTLINAPRMMGRLRIAKQKWALALDKSQKQSMLRIILSENHDKATAKINSLTSGKVEDEVGTMEVTFEAFEDNGKPLNRLIIVGDDLQMKAVQKALRAILGKNVKFGDAA